MEGAMQGRAAVWGRYGAEWMVCGCLHRGQR